MSGLGDKGTFTTELVCNILRHGLALRCLVSGFYGGPGPGIGILLVLNTCRLGFVSGIPSDTTVGRDITLTGDGNLNCCNNVVGTILRGVSSLSFSTSSLSSLSIGCSIPRGLVGV